MFNIASEKMRFKGAKMPGADPGFFFRGGCTRLLLYFNTNKPHSFFFGRIPVENRRSSQGRGGGGAYIYIYISIYIYIYTKIQAIHRWIQNSALQLRSGLTVNRLLSMSTYGF